VGLLCAFAGASDPLFVISCSLVLAMTALCYAPAYVRARKSGIGFPAVSLVRCSVGAVFGAGGLWFARTYGLARTDIRDASWELAVETATTIWNEPDQHARGTIAGLLCVALVALIVLLAARAPNLAGLRVLAFWQLAVTGAVLGAFLSTGAHFDQWTLRYLVTPCNLAVVLIAGLAARTVGEAERAGRPNPWPTRVTVFLIVAIVVGLATHASALVRTTYAAPHRAAAECVAKVAEREGVSAVLAEYWVAKPLMLFGDNRARVIQVSPGSFRPNFWITSRGWFRPPQTYGIVITNGLDPQRALELFGQPQGVDHCDKYELWIYRGAARVHMIFRLQYMFDKALVQIDAERKLGF
jgi:hypothetical protein